MSVELLSMLHRDVVKQKLRQDLMTENFSSVWLEVGLKGNKSILVGNIYRDWQYLYQADNTSLAVEEQLSRFSGFIEKWEAAIELSDECHLLGDMNLNFLEYSKVDILPNSQSYKLRSLIKLLFERILPLGAVQCVTSATRVSPIHEASGLDHYYTTNPQKLSSVATITNGSSDHKIICATRFSKAIVAHERVTKKRSYKYFNPEAFKLAVRKISWWEIYSSNDVNEAVQKLSDNLTKILDTMAPIKIFQNRTKYAPWLSASTKNWMKLRDQALEKALDTKNLGDFALYRKLRNKIVSILKTEKQAWYLNKIREASTDTSKTWKMVKSTLGWSAGGPPNQISVGGQLISKPVEIAEEMNHFFVSKIKRIAENLPQSQVDATVLTRTILRNRKCNFSLDYVHPDVVDKVISRMKNSKACGVDDIDPYVLKIARVELVPAITHIVNLSIDQGYFPIAWKTAKIVPLHKNNERTDPKNYRPVALLSIISKILERVIFQQITDYMESNYLLHPSHHGFRSGRSTVTALLEMHDLWIEAFDKKEITATMMLDLSAAFDLVSHDILLKKLELYGFDDRSIKWIKSYLTDRQQCVYIDGVLSQPLLVDIGVPQGSILGPLFYTIFTIDLPEVVHHHEYLEDDEKWPPFNLPSSECGGICAFADDSTFSVSRTDPADLNHVINEKYRNIASYMSANKLSLNSDKTHLMILTSARQHRSNGDYGILLNTDSELIHPSSSERLLGVQVSNSFTWNEHILQLVKNLTLKNNGLHKVCKSIDFKTRKILASSLINSQLIYCIQLYGAAPEYLINYLQVHQNRAARIVSKLDRRTNISELLKQVGWLSVRQMYAYHCLLLTFKTQIQQRPEYFCTKFKERFSYDTRRSRQKMFCTATIPKTETMKKSFFYNSQQLWNSLSLEVKNSSTIEEFKMKLKCWIPKSVPI